MARLNSILALACLLPMSGIAQHISSGPIMRTIAAAGGASTLNTDLIAYWKMDESSAGTSAVTRNDSEPTGTAQNLTDPSSYAASAAGKIGNSVTFNFEQLIRTDNADISTGDVNFTFAGWFYAASIGSSVAFRKEGSVGNQEYRFALVTAPATRFKWSVFDTANAEKSVTANTFGLPSANTWYFVVVWHDATNNQIGIQINNGTADTTATSSGVRDSSAQLEFSAFWDGRIDEVGFWKKVLNDDEKTELYAAGSGKTCCPF
jgi:hypothetical protein